LPVDCNFAKSGYDRNIALRCLSLIWEHRGQLVLLGRGRYYPIPRDLHVLTCHGALNTVSLIARFRSWLLAKLAAETTISSGVWRGGTRKTAAPDVSPACAATGLQR
jgi:hypothetical protein